jgi:hypothetical protein
VTRQPARARRALLAAALVASTAVTGTVLTAPATAAPMLTAADSGLPPKQAGIRVPDQPVYTVSARMLDDDGRSWRGQESLTFRNAGHTALSRIWLRLWANGPAGCVAPRGITISGLTGGRTAQVAHNCTAVAVDLSHAVAAGHRGHVAFSFRLAAPYGLDRFGSADGFSYLGNALPVLAIHDAAGWHLDPYTPNGEAYYTTVADFTVQLDHPSDVRVPATGTSKDKPAGTGRTLTTATAHHVRDFAWAVGPFRRVTGHDTNGVRVNVWWNPDTIRTSQASHDLTVARRAMAHDAKAFGAYPFDESDVVLDNFTSFGGMEYPGFVLSIPDAEPVVHEITHNWWYGIVGDDEYRAPWLDESFTEYVTLRFLGEPIRDCELPDLPSAYRLTRGMDFWDLDPFAYGEVIYADGPCALADLQKRLGTTHMDHLLRTYALAHRYGFSTTHAFKVAAQHEASHLAKPVNLTSFWSKWRIDG